MRNIKVSNLLLFAITLFFSCREDDPVYPIEPHIENLKVEYHQVPSPNYPKADSIQISFDLTDGDFDLGLNTFSDESIRPPFHPENYFVISGASLVKIAPTTMTKYEDQYGGRSIFSIESETPVELATYRTMINTLHDSIPCDCAHFSFRRRLVANDNISGAHRIDTLEQNKFVVEDTVLYEVNENHYNIMVNMLYKENGVFKKYNFWERSCTTPNGQFPILAPKNHIKSGPFDFISAASGSGRLTYGLKSSLGFRRLFASKKIKIQVTIRDRALHTSNTLESDEITFSQ